MQGVFALIRYVLFSLIGYWCSVFILPKSIQHKLEATMANFLWGSQESRKGVHLVAWKTLCRPVLEGGVGLKLLADWNKACISRITLHICQDEASWASFIKKKYLAFHSLWTLKCPKKESWFFKGVRKSWVHILHQVCVDGFYTIVRDTGEDRRDLQVWLNTGIVSDKCPRIVTGQACLQVASAASNGRQLVVFMLKDSDGLQRDQGVAWWEVNNVFPEDSILHQILTAGGLENFHEILLISNNKPWTRRLKTMIHGRRSPHGWLNHYSYLLHRLHILQQQPDHDILSLLARSM
ncbi:putative ribonuclease H protein [Nymphaea thermarum]|nr:putative ribonuclease H protein [Nymphaea thermarum]